MFPSWKKTASGQRVRNWYNQFDWYQKYKQDRGKDENRWKKRRLTKAERRAVQQLKLGSSGLRLRATHFAPSDQGC